MKNLLTGIDFAKRIVLKQVLLWMDGGSATLYLVDENATEFTVEFCQTMILEKHSYTNVPGSFLLNKTEIPIRSDEEQTILTALKKLQFSTELLAEEQRASKQLPGSPTYREIIDERIAFVESNDYLIIAKEMGRL